MVGHLLGYHLTACVCSSDFSTSHAFSCPHGASLIIRHNNIHDFAASLLSEICCDVKIQLLIMERILGTRLWSACDDIAHLDICAAGFGDDRHQHAFFDGRVFNSFAPSNKLIIYIECCIS